MKVNDPRRTQTNWNIFGVSNCGRMESASRVISVVAMVNFNNKGHIVGNFLSILIVNSLREIFKDCPVSASFIQTLQLICL